MGGGAFVYQSPPSLPPPLLPTPPPLLFHHRNSNITLVSFSFLLANLVLVLFLASLTVKTSKHFQFH